MSSSGKWGLSHLLYQDKEGFGAHMKLWGKLEQDTFSSRSFSSICQKISIAYDDHDVNAAPEMGSLLQSQGGSGLGWQWGTHGLSAVTRQKALVSSLSQEETCEDLTPTLLTSPLAPLPSCFKSAFRKYTYLLVGHPAMHFVKSKNVDTLKLSTGISQLSLNWNTEFWRANSSQEDGEPA